MPSSFHSDDLRHFLPVDGELSPQATKRLHLLTDICRFATIGPSGEPIRTAIRCNKRPGRRPCQGVLVARLRDVPCQVDWQCSDCDSGGRIIGWEGTDADLRAPDRPQLRGAIPTPVTFQEHEALRAAARVDPALTALTFTAATNDEHDVWLHLFPDLADDLCTALLRQAADADGTRFASRLLSVAVGLKESARVATLHPSTPVEEIADGAMMSVISTLLGLQNAMPTAFAPRPKLLPRHGSTTSHAAQTTSCIKVTLRDVSPPIWRRLRVPSDIPLPRLHAVLQAAMGWTDMHLHLFRVDEHHFAPPHFDLDFAADSAGVTLADLAPEKGARISYEYDFGDGWEHDVIVEDVLPDPCAEPRCLEGRRACPPEDCGGPPGYERLLEVLADPADPEHETLREWVAGAAGEEGFDAEAFDLRAADEQVREARPEPWSSPEW